MEYTIEGLKEELFHNVYEVYEIFQDFFGEQSTDLQEVPDNDTLEEHLRISGINITDVSEENFQSLKNRYNPFILVWWPMVTVTNENDRSIQIQDLYAKVKVTLDGTIPYEYRGFNLTRTTFSEDQYICGYIHSHIPPFCGTPRFASPCLGSGPINGTILELKNNNETAVWMLFCQELSLYVTVESLTGGPYFRMENIGKKKVLNGFTDYNFCILENSYQLRRDRRVKEIIYQFIPYYLQHGHLSLNYKDDRFYEGMPYFNYMIDISNSFIEFINTHPDISEEDITKIKDRILVSALAANGKFYSLEHASDSYDFSNEGRPLLQFKGEMKTLHIERNVESETVNTTLLLHEIAMAILYETLKVINYRFKNGHTRNSTTTTAATAYQEVFYI